MIGIGGSESPMEIYVSSDTGWINWFGLVLVALLLIPNMIWAVRHRGKTNKCTSRLMNIIEQIGRYGCMFLMVFNIGIAEFGFASSLCFLACLIGSAVLLLLCWTFWIAYYIKQAFFPALMLAVLPTLLFLLCGVMQRHWLLVGFAAVFGAGHVYVTACNATGNR